MEMRDMPKLGELRTDQTGIRRGSPGATAALLGARFPLNFAQNDSSISDERNHTYLTENKETLTRLSVNFLHTRAALFLAIFRQNFHGGEVTNYEHPIARR
jgi:hypothetical protein